MSRKRGSGFRSPTKILHTYFRDIDPYGKPSKEEEELCDFGAAALTMPEGRFRTYMSRRPLSLSLIDDCKTEFAVSFIAAGRRAVSFSEESACLFIAEMCLTNQERRTGRGTPALRVTRWWRSPSWPDAGGYFHKPIVVGSTLSEAFEHQDGRSHRGSLGIAFCGGVYEVEARGYGYPKPGKPNHSQVVALARGPIPQSQIEAG